jgi:hypothetical protein
MATVDYDDMLYDPIYEIEGAPAVLTLRDDDETSLEVVVLYQPSGKVVGNQGIGVGTVTNSAAIRVSELAGVETDHLMNATLVVNGETWLVKSWVPAPAPTGESAGEYRLILKEPSNAG